MSKATAHSQNDQPMIQAALDQLQQPLRRKNDPDQNRRDILAVATREFATLGLTGARIDRVAAQTKSSKRMNYYYFGSKEGLCIAVPEEAYRNLRQIEGDLRLDGLGAIVFKHDMTSPAALRTRRAVIIETILAAARAR